MNKNDILTLVKSVEEWIQSPHSEGQQNALKQIQTIRDELFVHCQHQSLLIEADKLIPQSPETMDLKLRIFDAVVELCETKHEDCSDWKIVLTGR